MTTVSDDFNRADSTSLGSTSVGGLTWVQGVASSWQIVSNQAKLVATNGQDPAIATVDAGSGSADCTLSLTMRGTVSEGLVFRVVDSTHLFFANHSGLFKKNPSFTTVGSYSSALVAGDVLTIVLSGSSITVQKNGTSVLTATDSFQQTVTAHGIGAETNGAIVDDFLLTYTSPISRKGTTAHIFSRAVTRAAVI